MSDDEGAAADRVLVSPGLRLRAEDRGKQAIPAVPLIKVNSRHYLSRFSPSSRAKERTTMILPGFEALVEWDRQIINGGGAIWDQGTATWRVEDRVYADKGTGTFYPVSGSGFVAVNREILVILTVLKRYDGDVDGAAAEIDRIGTRSPFDPDDVVLAQTLWARVAKASQ